MQRLNQKLVELCAAYYLLEDSGNWTFGIWTSESYLLYSNCWTEEAVDFLVSYIQPAKFSNFQFLGQRDLILQILSKSSATHKLHKDRLIYECSRVNVKASLSLSGIANATLGDYKAVAVMSWDNYQEEYNEEGPRSKEEIAAGTLQGIKDGKVFILKNASTICSMLQVINDSPDYIMVGNLFTKEEYRGRGYARNLLAVVTNGYLKNGYESCGLLSDITNASSNRVFIDIGYQTIYKWASVFVNWS